MCLFEKRTGLVWCLFFLLPATVFCADDFGPGKRTVVEAHNCYPYRGFWANRLDLALSCPFPVGVELDLLWHGAENEGQGRIVVAHGGPVDDRDYSLESWFFDRVRPLVEESLAKDTADRWPLITLNLNDIRGHSEALYPELVSLIDRHGHWFCSAVKGADDTPASLRPAPVLLLTGGGAREKQYFYDAVPEGGVIRAFGSGSIHEKADNFRRWINYPWSAVEPEGQPHAGAWTPEDAARLQKLVEEAHQQGYWIRFYTLNGHSAVSVVRNGWSPAYNFGSPDAVRLRWTAARDAGVDFIATDQCVEAAAWLSR